MHSSSMHVTCTCNIQMFMMQQGSIKKVHVQRKKKSKHVSDSSEEDNVDDGGDESADAEEDARPKVCVQFQPSPCIQVACMLLVHVASRCSWCSRAQPRRTMPSLRSKARLTQIPHQERYEQFTRVLIMSPTHT
jgi:hypothetical protein